VTDNDDPDSVRRELESWRLTVRLTFPQLEQLCRHLLWVIDEYTVGVGKRAANKSYREGRENGHLDRLIPIVERLNRDVEEGRIHIQPEQRAQASLEIECARLDGSDLYRWGHMARRLWDGELDRAFLDALERIRDALDQTGHDWMRASIREEVEEMHKAGMSEDEIRAALGS